MNNSSFTFIYDGECPFCNHFAELLELKSKLNNISILDARKNPNLVKDLLSKGFDIDQGAVLLQISGFCEHQVWKYYLLCFLTLKVLQNDCKMDILRQK